MSKTEAKAAKAEEEATTAKAKDAKESKEPAFVPDKGDVGFRGTKGKFGRHNCIIKNVIVRPEWRGAALSENQVAALKADDRVEVVLG